MGTDIQGFVDSVRLASGVISREQVRLERFEQAYEDIQAGRYEFAIRAYTDLLETSGPEYELTCLTNLIKCHIHTKSYAQAEQYYLQLKSHYSQESVSQTEVREACQLVESLISAYKKDEKKYDKYLALQAGIYEDAANNADVRMRLKLAVLDFEFEYYRQAFDKVLAVIEDEGTLRGEGYVAFREMMEFLGAEDDYVKVARQKFERIRTQLSE